MFLSDSQRYFTCHCVVAIFKTIFAKNKVTYALILFYISTYINLPLHPTHDEVINILIICHYHVPCGAVLMKVIICEMFQIGWKLKNENSQAVYTEFCIVILPYFQKATLSKISTEHVNISVLQWFSIFLVSTN